MNYTETNGNHLRTLERSDLSEHTKMLFLIQAFII